MVALNRDRIRDVIAGVDWGYTNPGVIVVFAIDNDGRMYLVREHYKTRETIDWWIERAKSCKRDLGVTRFLCDPAEPGFIEQFQRAGLRAEKGINEILPGIGAVQQRLDVAGDGKPRLYFFEDALMERDASLRSEGKPTCTAEEIASYVWDSPKDGKAIRKEKPVDESNHGLDALRYAVAHLDLRKKKGLATL